MSQNCPAKSMVPGRPIAVDHLVARAASYCRISVTERLRGGNGLSFRCDDLDTVCEPYTEDDFRQLVGH
jgi:hypothetical protein